MRRFRFQGELETIDVLTRGWCTLKHFLFAIHQHIVRVHKNSEIREFLVNLIGSTRADIYLKFELKIHIKYLYFSPIGDILLFEIFLEIANSSSCFLSFGKLFIG